MTVSNRENQHDYFRRNKKAICVALRVCPWLWNVTLIKRYLYLGLGFLCVALGFIGTVVPGIPTTPLILVAAWAFSRSSKRFESWLLRHRVFGPLIHDWRNYRGIRRKNKIGAILVIVPTFAITITLTFNALFDIIFALFGAALCVYLATRPEPPTLPVSN